MAFEPKSGDHAIIEAVLTVSFARAFTDAEIGALFDQHAVFQDTLPRAQRLQYMQFMLGNSDAASVAPPLPTPAGLFFDRFQPDGKISWRLRADNNSLSINCAEYSRWTPVWQQALKLMKDAMNNGLSDPSNFIVSVQLQTLDLFEWVGDESKYSADLLFDRNGALTSTAIFDKGPLWHLHQGWYFYAGLPDNCEKMLERINIDSLKQVNSRWSVRMDVNHSLDFIRPIEVDKFFEYGMADTYFDFVHQANKSALRSSLTSESKSKIKLDAQ